MNGSRDRFNEYSRRRYQGKPHNLRYRNIDDYYYEYRQPDLEQEERRRNARPDWIEDRPRLMMRRYRLKYKSPYGEHPGSVGRGEYLGHNKRRNGLGDQNVMDYYERENFNEEGYEFSSQRSPRRRQHHHTPEEREDYLERGQYEVPYHERDIYDPQDIDYDEAMDEEFDHIYNEDGFQGSVHMEGFGKRESRPHGRDWRDEDQYREGHASRRRGYGKYGSR
jgi:hypothetical protein